MKLVYVVTGSDDGILGVYGNKKGAYEVALDYVNDESCKKISYSSFCKIVKNMISQHGKKINIISEFTELNSTIHMNRVY
mgnify:CR=1 FL=1